MINTNNVSQNRGRQDIKQLTDYSDYDNMYEEILHYYVTEKYTSFPQALCINCGKTVYFSVL